jgi:hypothetical protein
LYAIRSTVTIPRTKAKATQKYRKLLPAVEVTAEIVWGVKGTGKLEPSLVL